MLGYSSLSSAPISDLGVNNYVINAESIAVTIAFSDVNTLISRSLDLESGEYSAEAALPISNVITRQLSISSSSYSISAPDNDIALVKCILADTAALNISGADQTPFYNRVLHSDYKSLNLYNPPTVVAHGRLIKAELATSAIDLSDSTLLLDKVVKSDSASYAITGTATLENSRLLNLESGNLSLSFKTSNRIIDRILESINYSISGSDNSIILSKVIKAESTQFNQTFTDFNKLKGYAVIARPRDYKISRFNVKIDRNVIVDVLALENEFSGSSLIADRKILSDKAIFTAARPNVEFSRGRVILAEPINLGVVVSSVSFNRHYELKSDKRDVILSAFSAGLIKDNSINAEQLIIDIATPNSTFATSTIVNFEPNNLSLFYPDSGFNFSTDLIAEPYIMAIDFTEANIDPRKIDYSRFIAVSKNSRTISPLDDNRQVQLGKPNRRLYI